MSLNIIGLTRTVLRINGRINGNINRIDGIIDRIDGTIDRMCMFVDSLIVCVKADN